MRFRKHTIWFIVFDFLAATLAWFSFFAYRKIFIEPDKFGYQIPFEADSNLALGLVAVPFYWLLLYAIAANYSDVWRKSRVKEISRTFSLSLLGVIVLFFALLLDDEVKSYEVYYKTLVILFVLHFSFTATVRVALATIIKGLINQQKIGFKTLVVGNNAIAAKIANEIITEKNKQGYLLQGFVKVDGEAEHSLHANSLLCLGNANQIDALINTHKIEEVIIALDSTKHKAINQITASIKDELVIVKIVPDEFDVLSGNVKMQNVLGTALIEINHQVMPLWQKVIKRLVDILVSILVLLVFMPVYILISLAVKLTSAGPVFYLQERIGQHGKPFKIVKFRTMVVNAEANGPALSSKNDSRITPVGKVLRKYRLDEIPQFYNVLIGEMSLVGPRPERQFFIDQLLEVAPHYGYIQRVQPGITSWGMVKYGYAENLEQMIERLRFDIIYIENRSLAMDLRILIYTIKTIVQGSGK